MTLADQIIQHGPYVAGEPLPNWMLRNITAAEANELRTELVELRSKARGLDGATPTEDVDPIVRAHCITNTNSYGLRIDAGNPTQQLRIDGEGRRLRVVVIVDQEDT